MRKRGEREEEKGYQENQKNAWEPRGQVDKMAELSKNQKLGKGKQSPGSELKRILVGGGVF